MIIILQIVLFILLCNHHAAAQKCEDFDRPLFHMLSKEVPDQINCVDLSGLRQGWWIQYQLTFNPEKDPKGYTKGYYVYQYEYGKYKNNKKVGVWKTVNNVHLVWEQQIDSYYYSKDTVRVFSQIGWYKKAWYEIISDDSSSIFATRMDCSWDTRSCDTIFISCYKKENRCDLIYKQETIKTYPFQQYEIVFDMASTLLKVEQENDRLKSQKGKIQKGKRRL